MATINYNIHFDTNGNQVTAVVTKIGAGVNGADSAVSKFGKNFNKTINDIANGVKKISFESTLNLIDRAATGLSSLAEPGLKLSTSMYDLQAITGVTGDKLKLIESYARSTGKAFGIDAAGEVESYKLILSKLTPEIAKTPAALKSMGTEVAITSKLMGGDSVAATDLLTTAMNQYQVSLDDPIAASNIMGRMMNVMAAAAKEGSAELPEIKAALEQAGMAAKGANVSFEETNAAIQVLDKAGKKGAEGGVALRNMLSILGQGRFMPKETRMALAAAGVSINGIADGSIPLAQRLKMLQPIMNDGALVTKLFGMENKNAAVALLSAVPEIERMTGAITGTSTAAEQAAIVMESPAEKSARLKASVDDLKISLFNGTNGWLGYAAVIGDSTKDITNLMPIVALLGKLTGINTIATALSAASTDIAAGATTRWAVVQAAFNTTMWANPITWIVIAVIALIAAISYVIYKTDGWGKMWDHTVKGAKLLWQAFVMDAKNLWDSMINGIMIGLDYIKKGWYDFKNAVGIGDSSENDKMIAAISTDMEARKKAIVEGAKNVNAAYAASAKEFKAAAGSLHWNNKKADVPGITSPVSTPGAVGTGDGKKMTAGGSGKGKQSNDAIATLVWMNG